MIVKATWPDILEVCLNIRKDDFDEVMATRWTDDCYDLAASFAQAPGGKFAVIHEDKAVGIFGVSPRTPGVGQGWLVGTEDIGKAGVEVAHACKKVIRTLFDTDVHRIQAYSAAFHHQAHEWLELIGFHRESTMKHFGKDGSDFYCYAVCKPSF
jgi:RimJ/RimL family protein N-acetyltransferase